jgi:nucleoside-diphosphate-sugar epimerase
VAHLRISRSKLEQKRRTHSSRFLLTGGTGFLGSHLAARLLQEDFEVTLLARPFRAETAAGRVHRIMNWHGLNGELLRRLRVVSGDLRVPSLGLEIAERDRLFAEADEIIHCASETSFAERRRVEVEEVNIGGLERLLDFVAASRCSAFHYLSTAFVAGRRRGICTEEFSTSREFHNAYEETKSRAEAMVWERCRAAGIRAVIYRPSIVYGDSSTGRSLRFNALYHPVRAVVFLRDLYLNDIRNRGGEKARAAGVKLAPDGITLHLPLLLAADGPGINLVPVDFFTSAFVAILETGLEGGIFHIVNGRPSAVAEIVAFTGRMFRLSGIEAVNSGDLEGRSRNTLEAAFDQMIEVYRPYMADHRTFATERSGPVLSRIGLVCPAFTFEVFRRCMSYALATGWGARLFEELEGDEPR